MTNSEPQNEVRRNGIATKMGAGGTAGLVAVAVTDAIVSGQLDADTWRAAVLAVVLATVTMAGKYAQACFDILGAWLARREPGRPL